MQEDTQNQRQDARRKVLKAAKIIYGNATFIIDCVVRDMSETGAKLKIDVSVEVPDHFQLYFKSDDSLYECKRKWRKGSEVGLTFEGEPTFMTRDKTSRISHISRLLN